MWPALTFLEEFMIFIPTESDLWACKLTHVCSPISVCCMCSSPLRKRQKTMARLIGCIPTVAEFRGSELVMGVEVGDWAEQFFYCLSAKWRLENDWEVCVGRVQRLAALSGRRWAGKQVAFNFGDFFGRVIQPWEREEWTEGEIKQCHLGAFCLWVCLYITENEPLCTFQVKILFYKGLHVSSANDIAVFSTIVSQSFSVYVCDRVFPPRLEFGMWRQTEDISSFKRFDKSPIKPSSSSLHPVSFSLIFLHDMDSQKQSWC